MTPAERVTEWLPFLWFLLVVVLLALLWQTGALSNLLARVTKFGGFGLSFEFTEESARKTRDTVEKDLGDIRTTINRQLAVEVRANGLQEAFQGVMDHVYDTIFHHLPAAEKEERRSRCRATLHIQDPLYENRLLQLLDYVPTGGGSGRTFSSRTGIIGVAWRTQRTDMWHQHSKTLGDDLIRIWGMTDAEAKARQSSDKLKLFLAAYIEVQKKPIGVFYFDAKSREDICLTSIDSLKKSYPNDDERVAKAAEADANAKLRKIEELFVQQFLTSGMVNTMLELVSDAKRLSPRIDLEGQ